MNYFTKEELEKMLEVADSFLARGIPIYSEKLTDKIQSMIDNYCEHESNGKDYCPGLYDKVCADEEINATDLNRVRKCIKCHRYFE